MQEKFPEGQLWLLEKIHAAGYDIDFKGQCHGLAYMAMRAFMLNDMDMEVFYRRLLFIQSKPIEYFQEISNNLSSADQKYIADEFSPTDIHAFFNGIVLIQKPANYPHVFSKNQVVVQHLTPAADLTLPGKQFASSVDTAPVQLKEFGITSFFTHENFARYLELLSIYLGIDRVSIPLAANQHTIVLNYDPSQNADKPWSVFDSNNITARRLTSQECANFVYTKSFNLPDYPYDPDAPILVQAETYSQEIAVESLKSKLGKLWKKPELNSLLYPDDMQLKETQLPRAVINRHINMVASLLKLGVNPNLTYTGNDSLLFEAVSQRNFGMANILIRSGAKVNHVNHGNITPLFPAIGSGDAKLVKLLIQNGAKLDFAGGASKVTPLFLAVKTGHIEVVKVLLENGAYNLTLDSSRKKLLPMAVKSGTPQMVGLLLNQNPPKTHEELCGILKTLDAEKCKYILTHQSQEDKNILLYYAALRGYSNLVLQILKTGGEVNYAIPANITPLIAAAGSNSGAVVENLLRSGAAPDYAGGRLGKTALLVAVTRGYTQIVNILIKSGANIYTADKSGETPLIGALRVEKVEIVKLLLKANVLKDDKDLRKTLAVLTDEQKRLLFDAFKEEPTLNPNAKLSATGLGLFKEKHQEVLSEDDENLQNTKPKFGS